MFRVWGFRFQPKEQRLSVHFRIFFLKKKMWRRLHLNFGVFARRIATGRSWKGAVIGRRPVVDSPRNHYDQPMNEEKKKEKGH